VTAVAVGGDGVAREASGRVVLVAGALPGERVRAEVVAERRDHARAVTIDVLDASADRVAPPCPFVAAGCGGCGWQHVDVAAQRRLKVAMVVDALEHLGGVDRPSVREGGGAPPHGYRTTVRAVADDDGRLALRRHHSHDLVAVPGCRVAHPLVAEVLADGRFPPGAEVTVRAGARTGERMVVVDGAPTDPGRAPLRPDLAPSEDVAPEASTEASEAPGSPEAPEAPGSAGSPAVAAHDAGPTTPGAGGPVDVDRVRVPEGVRVVTGDQLAAGKRAWLHEEVAGVRLRVSARSFFQSGPEAAESLVEAVADAAGELAPQARVADLYGGVGLFAATVGRGARVELVEASPSAAADARVNLAGSAARVVRSDVGRWRARHVDVVVADPPRTGLGRRGVRAVRAARAPRLVLVSCDAGALARDARLLAGAGYDLVDATVVDAFPQTPHVEVVSRFDRRTDGLHGRRG